MRALDFSPFHSVISLILLANQLATSGAQHFQKSHKGACVTASAIPFQSRQCSTLVLLLALNGRWLKKFWHATSDSTLYSVLYYICIPTLLSPSILQAHHHCTALTFRRPASRLVHL